MLPDEESGILASSFWDSENRRPTVDLFANYPMDFELLYRDSVELSLAPTPEQRLAWLP